MKFLVYDCGLYCQQAAALSEGGKNTVWYFTPFVSAFPKYKKYLKLAPTSFRPMDVSIRVTSWRADDKRLHVDSFPSRPNYGERILRVFVNVSPNDQPRVWRIGEPFEDIASRYIDNIKPYSRLQAKLINFCFTDEPFQVISVFEHWFQACFGKKCKISYS